ncbi:MAG: bifunctional serine/threonine-protein kinase/formylglycine-generating enzyme family protein [Candidatus Hydrogenedentes bacterium]|nr:bifunctional serine/threonine-protein kinase/formylglycine-generating enzyme family protein [Candidatus Hydrogenedentota bacterium]
MPVTANPSVQPEPVDFEPGTRIADRYVIETKIGKGGMGVVYRAHDALINEEVALKFMHPRALKTRRGQELFIKEAQVARRLRHDNIVSVHDVSTTPDGVLYLSMELLKGTSLRAYLKKHRQRRKLIDVRLAIDVTLQILRALEYAHNMVVHRDLKPENVMLLPGERVKVLDFGLAIAIEEEQVERRPGEPKPKRVVGTAAYASPEQYKHQMIDLRSDLYSVGLVLREMLTLHTPVEEPVTIMEMRQDVAPSVIEVLDKATMREKDRRWQSAREFRKALEDAYQTSYSHLESAHFTTTEGKEVTTDNMVYMPGGSFLMGSNDVREEAPEFETFVEPFYIDKCLVTVEEYEEFLSDTGHQETKYWRDPEFDGPRQPVAGVTLDDALAYAAWAGKQLPTEMQWEFAARGRQNRKYPWGSLEPDTTRSNFADYLGMPSIVTMHETGATPEGVYDMAGNVHEWTLGAYVPYNPKAGGEVTDSKEPRRVVRGGSWHSQAAELRTTSRKGLFRESQLTTVGFRCVLPSPEFHTPPVD